MSGKIIRSVDVDPGHDDIGALVEEGVDAPPTFGRTLVWACQV